MMAWITHHPSIWRAALLVGLLAALFGPWVFTSDGLPPPEFCQAPLLVRNERCVRLVSGMEIFTFMLGGISSILLELVKGTTSLTGRGRELLMVFLFLMPAIPFFTTLLLLFKRTSRWLRIAHTLAWGMVAFLCLFFLGLDGANRSLEFWGLWLCLAAAASALLLEAALWFSQRKPRGEPLHG